MQGCFMLYDVKAQKFKTTIGGSFCKQRFTACSTFKVPLALMAFDSGVLKDEKVKLKWDEHEYSIASWNRDHDAESWMKDSVVWYSQKLTPKLGMQKIKKYLKNFHYGNQDFSAGLETAWLTVASFLQDPNQKKGSLKISAEEQVEFMKAFWSEKIHVSKKAYELTKKIIYLEDSPKGYRLHGKTGSGFQDKEMIFRNGWFIGHLAKDEEEYIVVTSTADITPPQERGFAGLQAKEMTKRLLAEEGLW